jgi:hypothetical protein
VAQGEGPEFKPQYHKTNKQKRLNIVKLSFYPIKTFPVDIHMELDKYNICMKL